LHCAAKNGHKDVADLLLANKADVNARDDNCGDTPLHCAARSGHKDVADLLLASKADVNAKNENYHDRPLHCAAKIGHKDVAELLLANKADGNTKNRYGETPLLEATRSGQRDVAELPGQSGRCQRQGRRRRNAFTLGGEEWPQGCGEAAADQQGRCRCQK
jgi:ankyrin